MSEYSERETHSFFGHAANLSIDERNDLDEYLIGLPEFKEWDEAGFALGVRQDLIKAAFGRGVAEKSLDEACDGLRIHFRRYKDLEQILRRKVKTWCRAIC